MSSNADLSVLSGPEYDMIYQKSNYKIVYSKENRSKSNCAIYFSSSGIYYPNTVDEFKKAFILEDKYEWQKHMLPDVYKHIFIRDISKQFYITGISAKNSSINCVLEFLKEETKDYTLVTAIGSSAGGYMAALCGCLMNIKKVYVFSGFFDLTLLDTSIYPYIEQYSDCMYSQYYNLLHYIDSSETKIFYFYPTKLPGDCIQSQIVNECKNVFAFPMRSKVHGICFDKECLNEILSFSIEQLISLNKQLLGNRARGEGISPHKMTHTMLGTRKTLRYLFKIVINKILRKSNAIWNCIFKYYSGTE